MNILNHRCRILGGLFLTALLLSPSMVWADDQKKKKSASETRTSSETQTPVVMVTASRVEADLFELPMTVNVITAEDLKREPYAYLTDALAAVPGLTLSDNSGQAGAKTVSIRGEATGRTLVLINGVKQVDKRDGNSNILVDSSQIERIEIIKGPASVLYGPEAIGGVINIITKKGGDKPVSFSQNFILDSSSNSLNVQSAVFGSVNGFNYRFSGSGVNVKDRKVPGGTATTSRFRNRYYSGQLGYDWDKASVTLRADEYSSYIYYALGDSMPQNNYYMYAPDNDRRTYSGTVELRDLATFLPKVTLNGSYQNAKRDWTSDFGGAAMTGYVARVKSDQDQYSFSGVSEWSLGNHYVTAGWDYDFDDVHIDSDRLPYVPTAQTFLSWAKVEQDTLGVFLQDEWSFHPDYKLTLGARQTWLDSKFIDKEGRSYATPAKTNRTFNDLVGSAGLVYTGIDDLALRLSWSQGNRYPTVQQLYTGDAGHGGAAVTSLPNPDLEAETSNSYEMGARYQGGGWDVDGSMFYSTAKNYIARYTDDRGVRSWYNAQKAETLGAELALGYTFESTNLTPYTNATWIRRTYTHQTGVKSRKTGTPPFFGRVGLKWNADVNESQRVFVDLYSDWAAKTENVSMSGAMVNTTTATEHEAWQTLNLTLGLEGGEDHKYNASLSLRNIGNQHYVTSKGSSSLPEPGFHIVLGLGFEY